MARARPISEANRPSVIRSSGTSPSDARSNRSGGSRSACPASHSSRACSSKRSSPRPPPCRPRDGSSPTDAGNPSRWRQRRRQSYVRPCWAPHRRSVVVPGGSPASGSAGGTPLSSGTRGVAVTLPPRVQVEPRTAGVCHPLRAGSPAVRPDARKTARPRSAQDAPRPPADNVAGQIIAKTRSCWARYSSPRSTDRPASSPSKNPLSWLARSFRSPALSGNLRL